MSQSLYLAATLSEQAPIAWLTKGMWALIGALCVLLLQALAYFAWRAKATHERQNNNDAKHHDAEKIPSLAAVRSAAASGQPNTVQSAVLSWAAKFWPQTQPKSLLHVAQRLQEPALIQVFADLDAQLYGGTVAPTDLSSLTELMQQSARRLVDAEPKPAVGTQLPTL